MSFSQTKFSFLTDLGLLRSFKKEQQFWAAGQTIAGNFHFSPKDGAYLWFCYFSQGKFSNDLVATAKQAGTTPQTIPYVNNSEMKIKQFSLGWKHYLAGSSEADDRINVYGQAGFGLMFGRLNNTQEPAVDSAAYYLPVLPGKANFKRLTYDLALGAEVPLGGVIYMYFQGRVFIPASGYPSDHLLVNQDAPLTGSFSVGFRILFD